MFDNKHGRRLIVKYECFIPNTVRNNSEGIIMIENVESKNELLDRKNQLMRSMADVELHPVIVNKQTDMTRHVKLPLSRVPALGVAFEPLAAAFSQVVNGGGAGSGLYRVTVPKGGHLAEFVNGSGNLGTVMNANNQISGQAVLNPMVCNPAMLFMAVALANIDKKLDAIQETQLEILNFLVQKERSELKGDLMFLADILNNYKYNWNNDKYKSANHIKALDIKQAAERKIDFFKTQIASGIGKKTLFHRDQDVKKKFEKTKSELEDYQLALYLFAFSSFLEVMLLENFDSAYLNGIVQKIEDYSYNYRELFTLCYSSKEELAKSSIESHLLNGLSNANKLAGGVASKIPVINRSNINETLLGAGDKIGKFGERRIEESMKRFDVAANGNVRIFIENIIIMNKLYNSPYELVFDKENVYIGVSD